MAIGGKLVWTSKNIHLNHKANMKNNRVLIVEDDDVIRECLNEVLESDGYVCYQAANGDEAINLLNKIDIPSIILTDVMMPVMDGPTFITKIKQDERFIRIPVIYFSAIAQTGPQPFATRFIKKPVDLEKLTAAIKECCEPSVIFSSTQNSIAYVK